MSRAINDIYSEIISERNKRLELQEFNNGSKTSIMNGIAYVTAVAIHTFEAIMDAFMVDISDALDERINGTPTYYAQALLKYQKGDVLTVREDGLGFGYNEIDTTKRTITQVAYEESSDDVNVDSKLVMKVATGSKGALQAIPESDLVPIRSYINQIKFAGTRVEVVSREGDILVPRLTVYYDGAITLEELYINIEDKLNTYLTNVEFNSKIYTSDVIAAIRSASHVKDVYIDPAAIPTQGVFIAKYDSDGALSQELLVDRVTQTFSGFIKESTESGLEANVPNFRQSLVIKVEGQ